MTKKTAKKLNRLITSEGSHVIALPATVPTSVANRFKISPLWYSDIDNQLASWIVNNFGETVEIDGYMLNPIGYQTVLYVTIVLYIVALLLSVFFVKSQPEKK
jgi:hypothetical protein